MLSKAQIKAGGMLFISGQIPIDPATGELVALLGPSGSGGFYFPPFFAFPRSSPA